MPRKNLIREGRLPYHVTTRTVNQEFFKIPLQNVWDASTQALEEANKIHPIHLISFVLMSNHYHMLLITPEANIDLFMYEFNKRLAIKIRNQMAGDHQKQIFRSRYKWSLIESQTYFVNCYRYIYQNPIRAGLVNFVEDYPYSTLFYIANKIPFTISIHDRFGFKDKFNLLWLNEKVSEEETQKLKKKLRKYVLPKLPRGVGI